MRGYGRARGRTSAGFLPGTREGKAGGVLGIDIPLFKPDVEIPVNSAFSQMTRRGAETTHAKSSDNGL